MKLYMIFKQSLKAIFANKGRSFLTTLGIIIGIGSVIALISLGAGINEAVSSQISSLGTTNITVMSGAGFGTKSTSKDKGSFSPPGPPPGQGPNQNQVTSSLTQEDMNSLKNKKKNPYLKKVSGNISGTAVFETRDGEQRYSISGTSPSYFHILKLSVNDGMLFKQQGIDGKSRVMVLGQQIAKDIFGKKDPRGESLKIAGEEYEIIGILKKAEESGFTNPNSQAFIPYSTAKEAFNTKNFSSFVAQAVNEDKVDAAKADMQTTLLKTHDIKDKKLADFNINTAADLLSTVSSITGMLTALLTGIAAISLVVGGIGIMNIMLVSVTERTREIGLRKAVGAKTFDILFQFIIEAFLLTSTGGLIGIGLGILIGQSISGMLGFNPIVTVNSIILAVGVSSAVGLVFGIYPAAKAARLDPIIALRYE